MHGGGSIPSGGEFVLRCVSQTDSRVHHFSFSVKTGDLFLGTETKFIAVDNFKELSREMCALIERNHENFQSSRDQVSGPPEYEGAPISLNYH
jgi:hypothetical protein